MPPNILFIEAVTPGLRAACRFKCLDPEGRVSLTVQGAAVSYKVCAPPLPRSSVLWNSL